MSYRKRFVEWCQRPSRIKIHTFNPRNVMVLIFAFIVVMSSATLGAQQLSMPLTYITPEDIETLIVTSDTTLTEDYTGIIVIAADGITLDGDGHRIVGPGPDVLMGEPDMASNTDPYWMEELAPISGICLEGRTDVTIKNCRVTGFVYGVLLNSSDGNTLHGNSVNGNMGGFMLWASNGNNLTMNTAQKNQDGFIIWTASHDNILSRNTATNNTVMGFYLLESSQNTLVSNTATNNRWGFEFTESSWNTLQGNNATYNINGFEFSTSEGNRLQGNTATNNSHAGFHIMFSSSNNTLTENLVSNNEYGICYGTTDENYNNSNNRIYHNNFVNNLQHVTIHKSVNTWDDGYPSGGNYWSDYTGVDGDGDGIGDTPYRIDDNNTDRFPLMTPISEHA